MDAGVQGLLVGGALLASMGMGAMFTFVLASALWRHLDISCGCFSSSAARKISYLTLIRAIVIMLISTAAYAGVILLQPRHSLASLREPRSNAGVPARDTPKEPELLLAQE